MNEKIVLATLGTYSNGLYADISNSDLPTEYKVKFIEMSRKTKSEVLQTLRERFAESV